MASKVITCRILGGQESISAEHVLEVEGGLSALSRVLTDLKDTVNRNLSELVEREKSLNTIPQQQQEYEGTSESGDQRSSKSGHFTLHVCVDIPSFIWWPLQNTLKRGSAAFSRMVLYQKFHRSWSTMSADFLAFCNA